MTIFEELRDLVLSLSVGYVGVFGLIAAYQFVYNTFANNSTESSDEDNEEISDSEVGADANKNVRGIESKLTEEMKIETEVEPLVVDEDSRADVFELEKQLEINNIEKEKEQLNVAQNIICEALESKSNETIEKPDDYNNFNVNEQLADEKCLQKREYFDNQPIITTTVSRDPESTVTNLIKSENFMLQESSSVSPYEYYEMETSGNLKLNSNTNVANDFEITSKAESSGVETTDLQECIKDAEQLEMHIITTESENLNNVQKHILEEIVEKLKISEQNMSNLREIGETVLDNDKVEHSQIIINNISILDSTEPENCAKVERNIFEEKVDNALIILEPVEVIEETLNENKTKNLQNDKEDSIFEEKIECVPILEEPVEVIEETLNENITINLQNEKWRDEFGLVVEGLSDFYDFQASCNPSRSRNHSRNTSPCESLRSSSQYVPEISINKENGTPSILTTKEMQEMKNLVESIRTERLRVETNENMSKESTKELVQRLRVESQNSRSRSRSRSPLPTPYNIQKSLEKRRNKLIEQNDMAFEKLGVKVESTDAVDSVDGENLKGECTLPLTFSSTVLLTADTESIQQIYSFDEDDLDIEDILNISSDDGDIDSIDMINESEYFEGEYEENDLEGSEDEKNIAVEFDELQQFDRLKKRSIENLSEQKTNYLAALSQEDKFIEKHVDKEGSSLSSKIVSDLLNNEFDVDINYTPKREYNWRKNFRLDEDNIDDDDHNISNANFKKPHKNIESEELFDEKSEGISEAKHILEQTHLQDEQYAEFIKKKEVNVIKSEETETQDYIKREEFEYSLENQTELHSIKLDYLQIVSKERENENHNEIEEESRVEVENLLVDDGQNSVKDLTESELIKTFYFHNSSEEIENKVIKIEDENLIITDEQNCPEDLTESDSIKLDFLQIASKKTESNNNAEIKEGIRVELKNLLEQHSVEDLADSEKINNFKLSQEKREQNQEELTNQTDLRLLEVESFVENRNLSTTACEENHLESTNHTKPQEMPFESDLKNSLCSRRTELLSDLSDFYDFLHISSKTESPNLISFAESTTNDQVESIEVEIAVEIPPEVGEKVNEKITNLTKGLEDENIHKSEVPAATNSRLNQFNEIGNFDILKDGNFYPLF